MEKIYGAKGRQDGLYPVGRNKWELIFGFGEDGQGGWNWRHRFLFRPFVDDIVSLFIEEDVDLGDADMKSLAEVMDVGETEVRSSYEKAKSEYIAGHPYAQMMEVVREQHLTATDITDAVALRVPATFVSFEELCNRGQRAAKGVVFRYGGRPWRVVQTHTPMAIYPPGKSTAALYARIDRKHAGTLEDPIPYEQGMAFEQGMYYTQYEVLYLCVLTSATGFPNDLMDLPAIVQKV